MSDRPILLEFARVAKADADGSVRVERLVVRRGERVALCGADGATAELLVGLITGAAVPDEGEVRLFGRSTADIRDADEWLATLDRVGLVSPRAVWLPGSSVRQNLAVPFTLSIDPLAEEVARKVDALAGEVGIEAAWLPAIVDRVPPAVAVRMHLARALALDPDLLVLEQPTAALTPDAVASFGADLARVARARGVAVLVIAGDERLARAVGARILRRGPAGGAWVERPVWWRRLAAWAVRTRRGQC